MNKCPFHGIRRPINTFGDRLEKAIIQPSISRDIASSAYDIVGDMISDIFPPSFFEQQIDPKEYYGVFPLEARKIFQHKGEARIQEFLGQERKKGRVFTGLNGTKLNPVPIDTIITHGWGHACYVISVLLNHILRIKRTDTEYVEHLREAQKILITLAKQHLNIETAMMLNIDIILSRGYVDYPALHDSVDKIGAVDIPALGCPAVFFGDKRVGRMLFDWMSTSMVDHYKDRGFSKIMKERFHLSFQKIFHTI